MASSIHYSSHSYALDSSSPHFDRNIVYVECRRRRESEISTQKYTERRDHVCDKKINSFKFLSEAMLLGDGHESNLRMLQSDNSRDDDKVLPQLTLTFPIYVLVKCRSHSVF